MNPTGDRDDPLVKTTRPAFSFSTLWFIGPQKPQRCNLQKCICWKSVHPQRSVSFVCFNGTLSLFYDCVFMVHSSFPSFSISSLRHSFTITALFSHILPHYAWVIKGAVLLINDRFMHTVLSVSLSLRAVLRQYNDHCWHVGYCNGGCAAVSPSRPHRRKDAQMGTYVCTHSPRCA